MQRSQPSLPNARVDPIGRLIVASLIIWLSAGCGKSQPDRIEIASGRNLYVIDSEKKILITLVDQGGSLAAEVRRAGRQELFFMILKDRITTSRFTTDTNGNNWEIIDLKGDGIPNLKESVGRETPQIFKFYGGEFEPLKKSEKVSGTNTSELKP